MTLKQFLINVNRIPEFDVNRILRWDVGRALTRPVTNPLAKAACGYILGIAVFGFGGMMIAAVIGFTPSDAMIRLLALALAVLFAVTPNPRSQPGQNASAEGPAV